MAKLKDRRSSDNPLSIYRQKLEPSSSNSSSYRVDRNSSHYTSKIQLDSRKGSDGRRSTTCQCHKFVMDSASRDVPAQKSRLRSKESVFGLKDVLNARPRVSRQELVEEYYKMTKSMDSKPAFERMARASTCPAIGTFLGFVREGMMAMTGSRGGRVHAGGLELPWTLP